MQLILYYLLDNKYINDNYCLFLYLKYDFAYTVCTYIKNKLNLYNLTFFLYLSIGYTNLSLYDDSALRVSDILGEWVAKIFARL